MADREWRQNTDPAKQPLEPADSPMLMLFATWPELVDHIALIERRLGRALQAAARAAIVNDNVGAGTAVRTGTDSRTELTFADLTITRLGANTIFSFNEGARQVDLNGGNI